MRAYAHHGMEVVVCVFVKTDVWVDVTTLIAVAVLVAPGTVEVTVAPGAVEVTVAPGAVEVTVAVLPEPATVEVIVVVAPVPPTVVVLTAVDVTVETLPVGCRVAGGRLYVANPVFGGCALSCELTTTEYAVALTSVGSVPMVSGPVHTFVVVE